MIFIIQHSTDNSLVFNADFGRLIFFVYLDIYIYRYRYMYTDEKRREKKCIKRRDKIWDMLSVWMSREYQKTKKDLCIQQPLNVRNFDRIFQVLHRMVWLALKWNLWGHLYGGFLRSCVRPLPYAIVHTFKIHQVPHLIGILYWFIRISKIQHHHKGSNKQQ